MNEDPKNKPVRELLQDISRNVEPSCVTPRGFINPKLMDRITFFASILCVVIVAATFVGMIWNSIDEVFGFRFAASVAIFMLTLIALRAINSQFE